MSTSFLVRLYNAFMEARMRQARRELALHGYRMPGDAIQPANAVPRREVKRGRYEATQADAGMLPFVR